MSPFKEEVTIAKRTAPDSESVRFAIDPFGAHATWASRIPELGGSERSPESTYVFRTADLSFQPGIVELQLKIEGLSSNGGNLLIELVNRSSAQGSPPTRLSLQAPSLAMIETFAGTYSFTFEARRNTLYSVAGYIHGDWHVSASALTISTSFCPTVGDDKPADASKHAGQMQGHLRGTPRILTDEPASFCRPFSQPWTSGQEREADFFERLSELGVELRTDDPAPWSEAFILQVLLKFEVLYYGSRGLGLDAEYHNLLKTLAWTGAHIVVARTDNNLELELDLGAVLEKIRPDGMDEEKFFSSVNFSVVRTGLPLGYIDSFDFAWWVAPDALDARATRENVARLIAALRPGGIGVAVVPFDPAATNSVSSAVISGSDLERAAVEIISEGHDIVQLSVSSTPKLDAAGMSRFGLIFRRGDPVAPRERQAIRSD